MRLCVGVGAGGRCLHDQHGTLALTAADGPDPDGTIRFDVDPAVTYRLNAFYVNSGWPCPDYVAPNGDTFHFSDTSDHLGADLTTTTTTFTVDPGTCLVG